MQAPLLQIRHGSGKKVDRLERCPAFWKNFGLALFQPITQTVTQMSSYPPGSGSTARMQELEQLLLRCSRSLVPDAIYLPHPWGRASHPCGGIRAVVDSGNPCRNDGLVYKGMPIMPSWLCWRLEKKISVILHWRRWSYALKASLPSH
jgi:fermentation-respiration switch protein FrsA (DUF1100 family)